MAAPRENNSTIAYLVSEYPGISHTFIFREIQKIREMGLQVKTASIRRPNNLNLMTEAEKQEAAETLYIKESSWLKVFSAHYRLVKESYQSYLRMLAQSLLMGFKGPKSFFKGAAYFLEAGILVDWLRRQEIKHIHVHFGNPAGTVALLAGNYHAISFSLSIHGPDIFDNVAAEMLAEKVSQALFVRCISHYCQSQLMRLVPYEQWQKLAIVRCGVDPQIFQPRVEPETGVLQILCVGRLVPAKGQHILLEACGQLSNQKIPFYLNLVGAGPDRESLVRLAKTLSIEDKVTFVGAVGQDEIHQYYDSANVFVLPSFAEGVPVVLMEAMAKEIVCISTGITGIPELIDNGSDGILVTPADVDTLTKHLIKLAQHPELRKKMGRKGRKKILLKYDLEVNCLAMANLLKKNLFPELE